MNSVIPLSPPATPTSGPHNRPRQVAFTRIELDRIMSLYGRMVAAGQWRDYALELGSKQASFSAFRRAAENPEARVVKDPALRSRQGEWVLYGEGGVVLKRGHELAGVLAVLERRLLKAVEG
ncbi:DUF2794 domain-containing protein [Sandarakinorhabdus sp.]|uniref:DUF2794 domain-containing protein n=1 Tax=Sandarakinorhabdus sp. TaxID=1916663 RepID=UPI00333F0A36